MSNEEKVLQFKQKLDKMMKIYFFIELGVDAFLVAAVVVALYFVLGLDNHTALMIVVLVALALFLGSSFVITRVLFGSMQGMNRVNNFRTRADFVSKNLQDCKKQYEKGKIDKTQLKVAQSIFNDEMKKLAQEIDSFAIKKNTIDR